MLVLDLLLLFIISSTLFGGLIALDRYLRRRRLADPKVQALRAAARDEGKGEVNMLRYQLFQGRKCVECDKPCNPDQDLVVETEGWHHMTCFETKLKETKNNA